ncbi:MAG: hypothetical protein DMD82_11010 [Candidatus Rokuibacteriota bacterium]|nr:MAG: hypothetical protein DMD82_11010 [Candidatus Rokubacteria bacterium]
MKSKALLVALGAVTLVLVACMTAQAQLPKQGEYRGTFGGRGAGTAYELEKGHLFWVGAFSGVFFNDVANGFIDRTSVECPAANDIVEGLSIGAHGYCIVTDRDGDKAFLVFKQKKGTRPNVGEGDFQWTEGTGKYSGIKGNNTYRYAFIGQTPAFWVVWEGDWRLP